MNGKEAFFADDEVIVSKTDLQGKLTYVNSVFIRVSEYEESELLGKPHSMIRHPDMPRCIFKLLWTALEQGREIFAYVKNATKSGGYYWVLAHVTPSRDASGKIIGYHSNRRVPDRKAVSAIESIYSNLLAVESRAGDRRAGLEAGWQALNEFVASKNKTYDELIHEI